MTASPWRKVEEGAARLAVFEQHSGACGILLTELDNILARLAEGGTFILDCRRLVSMGTRGIKQSGMKRKDSTALV